jgi:serine/threonine protein phosphatase 1
MKRWDALLQNPVDQKGRAYFVEATEGGRRFAIGDIHGCFQTFFNLIKSLQLTPKDQVFVLGDLINRGPYSLLVVQYILELLAKGFQIYPLKGNHEELFLGFTEISKEKALTFAERQSATHVVESSEMELEQVIQFFKKLPYYYETRDAFLVHGGFDMRARKPLKRWSKMCWVRSFKYNSAVFSEKFVIHGHVPLPLKTIQHVLNVNGRIISLDNACVRADKRNYGRLACLNLDTHELITQRNADTQEVIEKKTAKKKKRMID